MAHERIKTHPIPVLVDNGINRAFAFKYFIYAAFGLTGIFTHVPSIQILVGGTVAQIISGCVFLASVAAMIAAWNYQRGIRWMKAEIYSTYFMISFVVIYNIALVALAVSGDTDRTNLAVLATALLVMPIWRVRDLIKKARR